MLPPHRLRSAAPLLTTALVAAVLALASPTASAATRYVDLVFTPTVTTDVVYGQALQWPTNQLVDLRLDVATPTGDAATDRPAIVWVHGGGFVSGSKEHGRDWIRDFAARGYVAVSIDYRLRPGFYFDFSNPGDPIAQGAVRDAVADAQAAVRWVRAHAQELGVDPSRIAIAGTSAGGVTAAGVAMSSTETGASGTPGQSSRVCVAASLSGAFSPAAADPLDDRVVFFHGTADERVPFVYADATHDALAAQGVPTDLYAYEGVGHGLGATLVRPDLIPYLATHLVEGPCTDAGRAEGGGYHALTPERRVDTRRGLGSPAAPLGPGESRSFTLTGLPGEATSVALNVTGVGADAATHLTVWPTGFTAPRSSNLNLAAGATSARMVLTRLGPGGAVSVRNQSGRVHVVVDLLGWFGGDGLGLHTGVPARVLDTRHGVGLSGPLTGGQPATFDPAGPGDAGDVLVLNTTGTGSDADTHLTVWPGGTPRPPTSTLNLAAATTDANLTFALVGATGLSLRSNTGTTHAIGDRYGWFDGDGGARFTSVWPTRVADTRFGLGASGPLGAGAERTLTLDGLAGLPPAGATAVALSVTAVDPTATTHLTVRPAGTTSTDTSAVNAAAGATVPNLVVVGLHDGGVTIANDAGATHLVVDVLGYFT